MRANGLSVLIQTTTPLRPDDWSVDSLTLLREELEAQGVSVTARNREAVDGGPDPVIARIDRSDFDELWLFALDVDGGITADECAAIERFRRRGGGLLTVRDHQDMGASICCLTSVGAANHFHSRNPERELFRQRRDDQETAAISWPNYHSGRNGDYQRIAAVEPVHPLLRDPRRPGRTLEYFPAHPHEGAVSAPRGDPSARLVAMGCSTASGRPFNLVVAFERSVDAGGNRLGRAAAHSSFHHFADYNWDTQRGAPSFVVEPEGTGMASNPQAAVDIRSYVGNLVRWLAPRSS
jgi:hypothetical protein